MIYYKNIADGYLESLSTGIGQTPITETEYESILSLIRNAPAAPNGYTYKFRADTLEWELVETPMTDIPEEVPTIEDKAEAYDILIGEVE